MLRRSIVAITVFGISTLAVPASSDPVPPATYEDAGGPQLRLADCEQQIGVFPVSDDDIAPLLPSGFTPIAFQDSSPAGPTGLPPAPGAEATLQLTATSCVVERGPGAVRRPITLVQAWTYVVPPEDRRDPGAGLGPTPSPYLGVLWVGSSDARVTAMLRRWGLPAHTVSVDNVMDSLTGCPQDSDLPCVPVDDVRIGQVDVLSPDVAIRLDTLVPVLAREATPEHLRLFGIADRQVTGTVDFVEEVHTHLMIGSARLTADGGVPFPVPDQPGVSLHVEPGYGLLLAPVVRR